MATIKINVLYKCLLLNNNIVSPFKRTRNARARGEMLSGTTQGHYLRATSSVLSSAAKWQIVEDNPCHRVKAPKKERQHIRFFEIDEAQRFIELVSQQPDKRLELAIMMLLYTSIHRGELDILEWSDIDLEKDYYQFQRTFSVSKESALSNRIPRPLAENDRCDTDLNQWVPGSSPCSAPNEKGLSQNDVETALFMIPTCSVCPVQPAPLVIQPQPDSRRKGSLQSVRERLRFGRRPRHPCCCRRTPSNSCNLHLQPGHLSKAHRSLPAGYTG